MMMEESLIKKKEGVKVLHMAIPKAWQVHSSSSSSLVEEASMGHRSGWWVGSQTGCKWVGSQTVWCSPLCPHWRMHPDPPW